MRAAPTSPARLFTARQRGGFTLMEMIVALSMFVLLVTGIYSISQATLDLTDSIALSQDRSQIRQNFIEFMRRSFRTLPGDAEVRLSVKQKGGTYLPTLNIVNGGSSFTPGLALPPDTSMDVYAEERPGGYLRIMLRVLDVKQTQAARSNQTVRYTRDQITLPLLDNVSRFEWRFFNHITNRWENNWRDPRRPILAEMTLQLDDGFQSRSVFWLPPVIPNQNQNPSPNQNPNPDPNQNPNPDPNPTPSPSPNPNGP
ncbi:MAG: prepilin-type N-terminal cleavage/methylation domain-containing protein [Prosthecobacter sp.]|jgi:prepilin-type N-terminal cleavage/methylation domain-containing protein|nr:prepilin-type N-terminal cleavage/methylation domain-containing protein [Prosthecobacter sp.]